MTSIFKENEIFVKEKVRILKYGNVFGFFNLTNHKLGEAREEEITLVKKIFKLTKLKTMLPFTISLYDSNNQKLVTLKRPFTWFLSEIVISDPQGNKIGKYKQKFKLLKPTFTLFDKDDNEFAKIQGNFIAWKFTITSTDGKNLGTINKKFAGLGKELFTTADNYLVKLHATSITPEQRKILTSVACIIDMVFKEYSG